MSFDLSDHWATVAENLHDGLLVIDASGVIISVNPAGEELTGYAKEELVGRTCRVLNCTGCKFFGKGEGEDYCGLFRVGKVRSKRCTITNKSGRQVEILKRAAVLKDGGKLLGAVETLTDLTELQRKEKEISRLKRSLSDRQGFHGMIGESAVMERLYRLVETVSGSTAPVLIQGASGTGKELIAQAIHDLGPRASRPFIKVNCAALNENLLESELFGHVKGAFTGADRNRVGRFEAASGGDILLDEIGDLPLPTQIKLLRVLESKEIERVGDHRPIAVDTRIIAATNQNLEDLITRGKFREELFYRIDVVPIHVPPLSARRSDIPALIKRFLEAAATRDEKSIQGLSPEAMGTMVGYPWPGNVRELKHAVEYAVVLCGNGLIGLEHLPPKLIKAAGAANGRGPVLDQESNEVKLCAELSEAMRRAGGNQTLAAEMLGVTRVTVWNRLKRCGLTASDFKS